MATTPTAKTMPKTTPIAGVPDASPTPGPVPGSDRLADRTQVTGMETAPASARGEDDADTRGRMGEVLRDVTATVADTREALMSGASATVATLRDAAADRVDTARDALAQVGERLADTLHRVSAETEGGVLKARVMSSAAGGLASASAALRDRSLSELSSDVTALARRHPGVFMAAAAVAGFAAARFVRASSRRRLADRQLSDYRSGPRA